MSSYNMILRRATCAAALSLGFAVATPSLSAPPQDKTNSYAVHMLVTDGGTGSVPADHTDGHLLNPWGIAFNPAGFVWVANNHTGTSTLYDGDGNLSPPPTATPPGPLVVTIPAASGNALDMGSPTGITFNGSNDFSVTNKPTDIARFIFVSEDGAISGWAPSVDFTHAKLMVSADALYKGVAIAGNGSGHFMLYAADFRGAKIDVYDSAFKPTSVPGGFADPKLPKGFAPFNIMNILGNLYVAYAKQEAGSDDEEAGPGLGFVNVFDADGNLIVRLAGKGKLNAPWGMALAPQGFGKFSNDLLVGNFGDGTINAFDPHDGHFDGQLKTPDGKTLVIGGLWGIAFGNGILDQQTDTLFFAAGTNDENNGNYGRIDLAPKTKKDKGGGDD